MAPEIVENAVESKEPTDHDHRRELGLVTHRDEKHQAHAHAVDEEILETEGKVEESHEHENEQNAT